MVALLVLHVTVTGVWRKRLATTPCTSSINTGNKIHTVHTHQAGAVALSCCGADGREWISCQLCLRCRVGVCSIHAPELANLCIQPTAREGCNQIRCNRKRNVELESCNLSVGVDVFRGHVNNLRLLKV